jgi:hypothetical protein
MDDSLQNKLSPLYKTYREVIKPLVAEIEVLYEEQPSQIYNEIRAFNDHVSRCYISDITSEKIEVQLSKANGHLERAVLDCYKFLNVKCHDKTIKKFERSTKRVDLTTVSNGEFYIKYKEFRKQIIQNLKEAKRLEGQDKYQSVNFYQQAHNTYFELEELIDQNYVHICRAIAKFYFNKFLSFFMWILSAIVSGIISSSIIPWGKWFKCLFGLFS